jgi:hypothetical protein
MSDKTELEILDLKARVATLAKQVEVLKDDVRYAYHLMRTMREGFSHWVDTGAWPDNFIDTLATVDRISLVTAHTFPAKTETTIKTSVRPTDDDEDVV